MRTLRIAMAQINPTVGDIVGNTRLIKRWIKEARKAKADVVAFPELALTGYPPEDLLLKSQFITDNLRALDEIAKGCKDLMVVVGYAGRGDAHSLRVRHSVVPAGEHVLSNAAAILCEGRVVASYSKWMLPNYGVFDESRYFSPGRKTPLIILRGVTVAVNICEDIWYPEGPTRVQAAAGAEVIVNINASPFHCGKSRVREQMLATRARENGVVLTYTNVVGGQDELVFDGNSVILDHQGEVIARGKAFEEDFIVADLNLEAVARARRTQGQKKLSPRRSAAAVEICVASLPAVPKVRVRAVPDLVAGLDPLEEVYQALTLGVRDYVRKNGFTRVMIGLSGGVDSALTAVLAVDALGPENVWGLFMPSPYTSGDSYEDVAELGKRLSISVRTIPITTLFDTYRHSLAETFEGCAPDTTEENLQARIRGSLLMAFSNKFGHLVLTTGNKSEMSVGYATLYGDMAGGFAAIKDVPKTMVYDLAKLRNRRGATPAIPKRTLDRPPTAELRPNQKDEDSLPPYEILDPILQAYVEEDRSLEEIVEAGYDRATVACVIALVDGSEYKRRQAPIGIKITHRALGKDRRMPITNGYRNS